MASCRTFDRQDSIAQKHVIPFFLVLRMIQKTAAPGSAEPQLRNAFLSFWSVKAELGLRVPGREGPVFFKIWY